jgi:energy-coupling factor transport system permease protein
VNTKTTHSVALLVASVVPALTVIWSLDPLTPLIIGFISVLLIVLFHARHIVLPSTIAINSFVIGTVAIVVASFLYAKPKGYMLFSWGWVTITEGAISVSVSTLLRILAIAVPALLIAKSISIHQIMATLAVRNILPNRIALATLISLRLVPVIANDVSETIQAQRARGKAMPVLAVANVSLVIAIRRAVRMSVTAEVRGFTKPDRLWRSYRRFGFRDWLLTVLAILSGIFAIATTVSLGMWNLAGA